MDQDRGTDPTESSPTATPPPGDILDAVQSEPRGSRRRSLAAIAATVIVVLGVAAAATTLGSSKGTPVSNAQLVSLVRSASHAFERVPSTTYRMTIDVSGQGHHVSLLMSGVTVTRTHASTFEMKGPGLDEGIIATHGIGYVQVPPAAVASNHGKGWLAVRSLKPTPEQRRLADSGPAGMLKALAVVGGTITNEGVHDVLGVPTTEYSFRADFLRVLGPTFSQFIGPDANARLKLLGFDRLPMKLWLDRNGLPREMSLGFSFRGVSMQEVAYMTPSNSIPTITAPPASDVRMVKSVARFGSEVRKLYGG